LSTRSARLGGPVFEPSTVWPSSGGAVVVGRRRLPDRHDRRIPAACVLLASAALAVLVFSLTRDPVRSLGVVYVAGLLIFVVQEAHDAWNDPPPARERSSL
jgi:peptidoglycan/LPS O-acetylase OafA/YrhL